MKVWYVEHSGECYEDYEGGRPGWSHIEKIFDSEDKAVAFIQKQIKTAIDEYAMDKSVEYLIDHIPSAEELHETCVHYITLTDCGFVDTEERYYFYHGEVVE